MDLHARTYPRVLIPIVGNHKLLCSHALDHIRYMRIYPRPSESIIMDKQILKNNMDTIEIIDLKNKTTYL